MTQAVPVPTDPRGSLPQIIINQESRYEGTLVEYFQGIFYLGKNTNMPYHNFRHCTHILYLCHEAARFYGHLLSRRKIRNLLIAALFHDFDHRGVGGDDASNIELAIKALEELILPMDKDSLEDIRVLLRGTQFPYILCSDELPFEGLILRDADMMQAFSPAWIQQVVFGLAAEWGKSPREVLMMQKSFLSGVTFYTEWANLLVPEAVIALKINEAEALLDILDMSAQSPKLCEAKAA